MQILGPSRNINRVEKRITNMKVPAVLTDTSAKIGWIRTMIQNRANAILRNKADKGLIAASGYSTKHLLKDMSGEELGKHIAMSQGIVEAGWDIILSEMNKKGMTWKKFAGIYKHPKLQLFTGVVETECGPGVSEVGPFYCPLDRTMYVDPAFYTSFSAEFAEKADDFLPLYVQGHEKGHHVQNLFGIIDFANDIKAKLARFPVKVNKVTQILELQADYLLGVALHHANKRKPFIEEDDIGEAMEIAMSIGDDMLQQKKLGFHDPRGYTHGDSGQRSLAFLKGLETGDWEFGFDLMSIESIIKHVVKGNDNQGVILFDPAEPVQA